MNDWAKNLGPGESVEIDMETRQPKAPPPSIGRIVHFRSGDGPCQAALISHVHGPHIVNLMVVTPNGTPFSATSVDIDGQGASWHWPERV
jgi:hypothetical protein